MTHWADDGRVQAAQQGQELRELLQGAEGFAHVQQAQRGIKARKAVQQALHPLRRLGTVLRPVLPQAAFVAFGAAVLQAAASKVVGAPSPCGLAREPFLWGKVLCERAWF